MRRISTLLGLITVTIAAPGTAGCAEEWVRVMTPHFTVFSEASEGRTRDWAVEFELFRRGMSIVMPVPASVLEPVTLVLFRNDRRLRPFKPLQNGEPAKVAGFFARPPGRQLIALSIERSREEVRELIYHEAVHWHLTAAERPRPLWLEEGLAQVFGNFRLSGASFVIGTNRLNFIRHLESAKPMPYETMVALGVDAATRHGEHTALFYLQAWAMTHALVFGRDGKGVETLATFLQHAPIDRDPSRDFERSFGFMPGKMDALLDAHLRHRTTTVIRVPFDRTAVESEFVRGRASAADVDLSLGELLVGSGRAAEAEPYLQRAAAAQPKNSRTAEALGGMYLALDRTDDATIQFAEAIRAGSRNAFAYFFVGQQALRAANHASANQSAQREQAVAHLVQAVKLNPRLLPAYESLALAAALLPTRSSESSELIDAAVRRYPANPKLLSGQAMLAARFGEHEKAHAAAERAQRAVAAPASTVTP